MKTGVIIYVVGSETFPEDFNEKKAIEKLTIQVDRVEVVVPCQKHFDVNYAWWKLISKGMHRVVCKFAMAGKNSTLQLTGREFQLSSY